ncbi:hypothetical protein RCZ04_05520 [Capnocytophaga sp. HP1101]
MLSAVADRFGLWGEGAVWGNMDAFLAYTQQLLFFVPASLANIGGWAATMLEIIFPICLLIGFKTNLVAKLTGCLLASFGLSMVLALGIKSTFDYSVWNAVAAAFAIAAINSKYLEIDTLLKK